MKSNLILDTFDILFELHSLVFVTITYVAIWQLAIFKGFKKATAFRHSLPISNWLSIAYATSYLVYGMVSHPSLQRMNEEIAIAVLIIFYSSLINLVTLYRNLKPIN